MRHLKLSSSFSIIIFAFVCLNLSFAQNNSISGKVIDRETGEPLIGATVRIENTKLGALTDKKGEFGFTGLNQNDVSLKITFVGYEPQTITHDFSVDRTAKYTVKMVSKAEDLDEVEVEAQAEGQTKALLEQKRAANIKNIVSAEQIEQFPDLNAAEAMQRIPGITLQRDQGEGRYVQLRGTPPELTNFNINGEQIPSPEGDVRYVGMDIISADQIDMIEITKVLTPDMDADGIGGNVNIVTKKATSAIPRINATLAGGYNNLRRTGNYQLQFNYGQRLGDFGFNMNASYYQNRQGSDNMEFSYGKGPFWGSQDDSSDNYHVQYREVQLRHYDILRSRTGLSATLDYEFNKKSNVYIRGMFNNFSDEEVRRRKIYDLDDAFSETYYNYGGIDHDLRDRVKIQNVNTLNVGGEHELFRFLKVDYEAAYAYAEEDQPDRMEVRFENPGQSIKIKFDTSDPDWPVATYPDSTTSVHVDNYEKYDMDELLFEKYTITDQNLTSKLNFTIPYDVNLNNSGIVKFGGKVRFKDKERDIESKDYGAYKTTSRSYYGEAPEMYLATITDGFTDDNLLNKGYRIEYMPGPKEMREFFNFYPEYFIYDRNSTKMNSFGADYSAKENIYAGYAMVKHDIGKLMLLGGVRYERTDIDYMGMKILSNLGEFEAIDTLEDVRTHEFVLPQFQVKYTYSPNFNLRGALTFSYARPNFEDVIPYREEDRDEVKYGNPDLNFPRSMNIDLLAERYLYGGGLISGGVFYKKIDDFVFYFKRFAHEGEDFSAYGLVEIEKAINGIEAFVYGAELQSQFKFDFLPSILGNFGIFTNYTYTYSEAYIYKRYPANDAQAVVIFGEDDLSLYTDENDREKITLPGQAMHTLNLALYYETGPVYAKLSANYHDDFLYELGADPDLDEYYDHALHMDFTANYALTNGVKVFVDVINLTNAPLKFYLGTPDRIQQQEYYSWWGRVGLKISY